MEVCKHFHFRIKLLLHPIVEGGRKGSVNKAVIHFVKESTIKKAIRIRFYVPHTMTHRRDGGIHNRF